MEAVGHAGTCLGIVAQDGIVMATERRHQNKLLDDAAFSEKIYRIHDDVACAVAGITADANVLINEMRIIAQRHLLVYQEPMPLEQLVTHICDIMHTYTMYGGRRPFGVSMLFIGWDQHFGFQMYQSDPSGNFMGWRATCIGSNASAACSLLEQEYKQPENVTVESGLKLAVTVMNKTMTMSKLTAEKVEIATLTRRDNKTYVSLVSQSEVERLIKTAEEEEPKKDDKCT